MSDAHEALVEKAAHKLAALWPLDTTTHNWDFDARAVIALIAKETKEATPEQVRAWAMNPLFVSRAHVDGAAADWSAMHAASALWQKS